MSDTLYMADRHEYSRKASPCLSAGHCKTFLYQHQSSQPASGYFPFINLEPDTPGRYTMSVTDLVDLIQKKEPDLDITPLGEPSFILTYQPAGKSQTVLYPESVFISLASFFGAAFSIMTLTPMSMSEHFLSRFTSR